MKPTQIVIGLVAFTALAATATATVAAGKPTETTAQCQARIAGAYDEKIERAKARTDDMRDKAIELYTTLKAEFLESCEAKDRIAAADKAIAATKQEISTNEQEIARIQQNTERIQQNTERIQQDIEHGRQAIAIHDRIHPIIEKIKSGQDVNATEVEAIAQAYAGLKNLPSSPSRQGSLDGLSRILRMLGRQAD